MIKGYYHVFRVRERLAFQMHPNETRHHNIIFVETNADRSGDKINITGDITSGYRYEKATHMQPELSESFVSKEFLGYVRISDYPALEAIFRQQPVPTRPQQRWHGGGMTGGYRRCKEDGSFYDEGETVPPLSRCTEWTDSAILALQNTGLLHPTITASTLTV